VSHGCPFAVAHKSIGKKLKKEKEARLIGFFPAQAKGEAENQKQKDTRLSARP